jgi:integrase
MVFRRSENGSWFFEFQFRGVRIRENTHSPVKAVALRLERERRRGLELGTGGLKRIASPLTFARAAAEFQELRTPGWAPRTRGVNQAACAALLPHFGRLLLADIQPKHIAAFQRHRQNAGMGGRSINIEVALLRQVLIHHRLWANIAPDVRMLREREDVGRALTADEMHRLLTAARSSASRSLYPALVLALHTGLRNEELRHLRWRQANLLGEAVTVGKSKTRGGEGRVVPLSDTALAALKAWRSQFPSALPEHYVFPSERYGLHGSPGTLGGEVRAYSYDPETPIAGWKSSWTTCRRAAGVQCRWHDMRHSFVSRLGDNAVSDQTLMALAGHVSRKMLERYSHARSESKRAAVKLLDGLPLFGEEPDAFGGGTSGGTPVSKTQ